VPKKGISETGVNELRVLMRVDFNVPLDGQRITDDRRIVQSLESIRSVIERGGKLILASHLGRPDGRVRPELSLRPIAEHLSGLLGRPVAFADACTGPIAERAVGALKSGEVLLLENLRFFPAETLIDKAKKNPDGKPSAEQQAEIDAFADGLCALADLYCNNAFGTCHRNHVSMFEVPRRLGPGRRVCGHLVLKELQFLGEAVSNPGRPFVAILGGAKVSDKIGVIDNLLAKVDRLLIGGAMAYTFLASQGRAVGGSLCEGELLDLAANLVRKAEGKICLPADSVCATALEPGIATSTVTGDIDNSLKGFDVGPKTIGAFSDVIAGAATIIWNGPMGVFEVPPFDAGTLAVARALAKATQRGATTIIGGGDSAAAVHAAGLEKSMTHISTGGGASLEFLEGKVFDTIDILDDA
jgi:phosphoglycerate kinase